LVYLNPLFHIKQTLFIRFSWINTYYLHILGKSVKSTQQIFEKLSIISAKINGRLNDISKYIINPLKLDSKHEKLERLVDDL